MKFKNISNFLNTILSTCRRFLAGGDMNAEFKDIEERLGICRVKTFTYTVFSQSLAGTCAWTTKSGGLDHPQGNSMAGLVLCTLN